MNLKTEKTRNEMTHATEITGTPHASFQARVIAMRGGEVFRYFFGTVNEVREILALEDDGATWKTKAIQGPRRRRAEASA